MIVAIALSLAAAPTTFNVTSGEVTFEIDAPLDTISGISRGVTGSATFDPAAWTQSPQAKIDVDLTTFRTGIELRDEDLRDQFFESSKFAKATLTLNGLERASVAALVDGTAAEAVANGTLSLHGVERPVQMKNLRAVLDQSPAGQRVIVTGDFVVPILDHHITRPRRLIFKLGTDVKVHVRATLKAPSAAGAVAATAKSAASPEDDPAWAKLPPAPIVARPVVRPPPAFQFAETTPEGKGERAFVNAKIGGEKNALSCKSCHGVNDERKGLAVNGIVKPSSSMWNAALRTSLWQGIAQTPGHAADICAKLFMLREQGLDAGVRGDLEAYLKKLAHDPQPALDYEAIHLTRRSYVDFPEKGDAARGKKLVEIYCASCHAEKSVRPPLTPGLYEADFLVKRVRRIPGNDNRQMPLLSIERLPDSELRDIVTYLVGNPDEQIFQRAKKK
jgi:polyisoprenoid-binding protein YceI/mono/diheme cytochrome c family protein